MKRLRPDPIRPVYDREPDAAMDLVPQIFEGIEPIEVYVAELERQVHRNSRNGSQPPSTDGWK